MEQVIRPQHVSLSPGLARLWRSPARLWRCLALLWCALALGCATGDVEGDGVFREGLTKAEAGQVDAALQILQEGAKSYPSHVRMRFELARLQYEKGEAFHLGERRAIRASTRFLTAGKREEAAANRRLATQQRAKALPFYQAARENLHYVTRHESENRREAWALFLLMRVAVFFGDYETAYEHLEHAIKLGKPTGRKLAQWREYQGGLRSKLRHTDF